MTPSGSPRPSGSMRLRGRHTSSWSDSAAATVRAGEEGISRSRCPRPRRGSTSWRTSVPTARSIRMASPGSVVGPSARSEAWCSSKEPCGSDGETCSSLAVRSSPRWRVIREHRRIGTRTRTRRRAWCSVMAPLGCSGMRPSPTGSTSRSKSTGRGRSNSWNLEDTEGSQRERSGLTRGSSIRESVEVIDRCRVIVGPSVDA